MITMDFETYVPTNAPATERAQVLAAILKNEDAAGIEYAVVMPNPTPQPQNQALAETVKGERRVVACCQVNLNDGAAAIKDVDRSVTQLGMRMLKIMPTLYHLNLTGPLAFGLMAKARELGIVVNIHSGGGFSHPLQIGALCRRYPEVNVIMDHMGYREWSHDAIVAAEDNPSIYLGTTIASFEPSYVERAIKELGPERVIYGSNLPALDSDLAVEALRRQKLGREAEELLLGGNLARLLGMA
ncbi:MAG TPA: amidohydrolase family protein, partial [Chloroflexota bacterium]|nr:amidohydrolase family protein [Chloroflexota bacterium]